MRPPHRSIPAPPARTRPAPASPLPTAGLIRDHGTLIPAFRPDCQSLLAPSSTRARTGPASAPRSPPPGAATGKTYTTSPPTPHTRTPPPTQQALTTLAVSHHGRPTTEITPLLRTAADAALLDITRADRAEQTEATSTAARHELHIPATDT